MKQTFKRLFTRNIQYFAGEIYEGSENTETNESEKIINPSLEFALGLNRFAREQLKEELQKKEEKRERINGMNDVEFLNTEDLDRNSRIKYVTTGKVESFSIKNGQDIEFCFPNREQELMITAGNIFPESVEELEYKGKLYTRGNNLRGEFFNENHERLIILNKTVVRVNMIRKNNDLNALQEKANKDIEKMKEKYPDYNESLIKESILRGIDIEFANMVFGKKIKEMTNNGMADSHAVEILMTDFDRIRGYYNVTKDLNDLVNAKYDSSFSLALFKKYSGNEWKQTAREYGIEEDSIRDFEDKKEGNMYISGSEINNEDSFSDGTRKKGELLERDEVFMTRLKEVAKTIGVSDYKDLLKIMYAESGLDSRAINPSSNATGLIQFMPNTAEGLGTSVGRLREMSALKQLDYVEKYFRPLAMIGNGLKNIVELYQAVFYPASLKKGEKFVFGEENKDRSWRKKVGQQNSPIDKKYGNGDGEIDMGEFRNYVNQKVRNITLIA